MLDFSTLKKQINGMMREEKSRESTYQRKIERALKELKECQDGSLLNLKLDRSKTSWLTASDFSESPATVYPPDSRPKQVTVIATDGSQIFPDRHELTLCYLINISSIVLHYGMGIKPTLTSHPALFYKEEDLYTEWNRRRIPVDEKIVGILRNLMEFQELAHLAEKLEGYEDVGACPSIVAFCDGTLIFWNLESAPEDFSDRVLEKLLKTLDYFQEQRIPIAGYISYPRSTDVINSLRVGMCPENVVNCDRCPYHNLPELPCEPIEGVIDQILFSLLLEPGERSPVFKSSSKILKRYGFHYVYFFYLNVGTEIARVEIPQWVAKDLELLNLTHAVVYDQAEKGQGYPISLTEAHEKAVVRGVDRELFYRILRESFVQHDLKIQTSRKSQKKKNRAI